MSFSLSVALAALLSKWLSVSGADSGIPEGGSKIKFMKGEGSGGGVPPPVAGPGSQRQPLFLVFDLFGMKVKALFTMILFQNSLILTSSSITFGLKGLINKSLRG